MSAELIERLCQVMTAINFGGVHESRRDEAVQVMREGVAALEAAEAELAQFREWHAKYDDIGITGLVERLAAAEAENARLRADIEIIKGHDWCGAEAKLTKIDALHQPVETHTGDVICQECDTLAVPCPTRRILHPNNEGDET